MSEVYFCETCVLVLKGHAMSEAEWIQHVNANPTHMRALDESDEEEFKEVLKS